MAQVTGDMDHDEIAYELSHAPSLKLLQKDTAALIISFLYQAFKRSHRVAIPYGEVLTQLDDILLDLNTDQPGHYPRSAHEYLKTWSDDDHRLLRLYYERGQDEPLVELTPDAERVIGWFEDLQKREFVGTESRFMRVFELLEDIAGKSTEDAATRLAQLERQRDALQQEIDAIVQTGRVQRYTETQIKERFREANDVARRLLADFREVEQNFCDLDRAIRERIATWEGSKGALLEDVFGERDAIRDSDQGASFRAFWDLLMSSQRQEELSAMLEKVFALPAVKELEPDRRLLRVHHDWLEAGELTQRTVARVSAQLRRYLDDQAWLENRRIMQLIRRIEHHAVALRDADTAGFVAEIDEAAPTIELPLERPLFKPPYKARIDEQPIEDADAEVGADALFEQEYVDRTELRGRIRRMLVSRSQVSLAEIVGSHPLEHGLAEIVVYMGLAADDDRALIDDARRETLRWIDEARGPRQATVPLVVWRR